MIYEKNHCVRNTDTYRILENVSMDTFNYSLIMRIFYQY